MVYALHPAALAYEEKRHGAPASRASKGGHGSSCNLIADTSITFLIPITSPVRRRKGRLHINNKKY